MAWNSFLSNFLTIVFTLFEGKNTHLKVIKQPRAMCLFQHGGRGEGLPCFPKGVAGRGWDTRVPQVKRAEGCFRRVLGRRSRDLPVVAAGHLQWSLGTRTAPCHAPVCSPKLVRPARLCQGPASPSWSAAFATEPGLFTQSTLWGKLIIFTPRSLAGVAVPLKCFLWGIYRPF